MTIDTLSIFVTTLAVYMLGLVSPGPDFALVLRNSIWNKSDKAWPTALGIASGVAVHLTLVTLLLSAGSKSSESFTSVATILGGIYLAFLGLQTILLEWRSTRSDSERRDSFFMGTSNWDFFRQGLWTNLFNPKAAAFFWSVLTGAALSLSGHFAYFLLIALMVTMTLLWFWWLGLVLKKEAVRNRLQKIRRPTMYIMGLLLIAFSAMLFSKLVT